VAELQAIRRLGRVRPDCEGRTETMGADLISDVFWVIQKLISLYIWAIILSAVFSTLASFGVLDTRNRLVWSVGDFLDRVTAPLLNPIRRIIPYLGSIDISPLVAILLLSVLQRVVGQIYVRLILSGGF
jgi:YggT family protein